MYVVECLEGAVSLWMRFAMFITFQSHTKKRTRDQTGILSAWCVPRVEHLVDPIFLWMLIVSISILFQKQNILDVPSGLVFWLCIWQLMWSFTAITCHYKLQHSDTNRNFSLRFILLSTIATVYRYIKIILSIFLYLPDTKPVTKNSKNILLITNCRTYHSALIMLSTKTLWNLFK